MNTKAKLPHGDGLGSKTGFIESEKPLTGKAEKHFPGLNGTRFNFRGSLGISDPLGGV